jgi:hypothetical protein
MPWIVIVNRKDDDRSEVVVVGPFEKRDDAQNFIEEAHDDLEESAPHLWLDDVPNAEIMFMDDPEEGGAYAYTAMLDHTAYVAERSTKEAK